MTSLEPSLNESTCLDPAIAFASFSALAQCFSLFGSVQHRFNGYELVVDVNSTFGSSIGRCFDQYCQSPDPEFYSCYYYNQTVEFERNYRLSPESAKYFYSDHCEGINDDVNEDIGGAGVVVSYVMQISMNLYMWICFYVLQWTPVAAHFFHTLSVDSILHWRRPKTRTPHGVEKKKSVEKRLMPHSSVIKSMMVEFQEAQCFFMLSIQIAALMGFRNGQKVFDAGSLRQLENDMDMARTIALMGIIPIVFGAWILERMLLQSWYTLFLSTATVVISGVILFLGKTPPIDQMDFSVATEKTLDKCGYHPPPLVYCKALATMHDKISLLYALRFPPVVMGVICISVLGLLIFKKLLPYSRRASAASRQLTALHDRMSTLISKAKPHTIGRVLFVLIEILLLFFMILTGITIVLSTVRSTTVDMMDWSFGQIIAVMIWAPTISKYFHWAMFGTDSFSSVRFPEPYRILRIKSFESAQEDPTSASQVFIHVPAHDGMGLQHSNSQVTDMEMKLLPGEKNDSFHTTVSRYPI